MANQVSVTSDTCTLHVTARPVVATDPPMEFVSGSFAGSVDERRVANVNCTAAGGFFSLRFEFTDPTMAGTDIWGTPTYVTQEDRLLPYTEIAGAKKLNDPRNPDVVK